MAVIKKRFFEVELPLINQKADLYSISEEKLDGKTIKVDMTRRLRGKSLEIAFKIKFEDGKLSAIPQRMYLLGYFIRRMMRKAISYVEDSFSAECKDAVIRIKPFLITRKKVSRKVRNVLRKKAKEEIEGAISNKNIEEIFYDILSSKFQKSLSLKLKKIYPLALCEIRDIYIEKPKSELKIKEEKVK